MVNIKNIVVIYFLCFSNLNVKYQIYSIKYIKKVIVK